MDPQQQHAANVMAGMGAGIILFAFIVVLAIFAFWIFLYWRIFTKAGLSGALSLIILFPFFGYLIVLCILAFSEWKVVPAPNLYPRSSTLSATTHQLPAPATSNQLQPSPTSNSALGLKHRSRSPHDREREAVNMSIDS